MKKIIKKKVDNLDFYKIFKPELTPKRMMELGVFGGAYFGLDIKRESLMGGMSCGEVSLVPWEILKNSVKHCISLPDDDIAKTMKLLGNSSFSDDKIIFTDL